MDICVFRQRHSLASSDRLPQYPLVTLVFSKTRAEQPCCCNHQSGRAYLRQQTHSCIYFAHHDCAPIACAAWTSRPSSIFSIAAESGRARHLDHETTLPTPSELTGWSVSLPWISSSMAHACSIPSPSFRKSKHQPRQVSKYSAAISSSRHSSLGISMSGTSRLSLCFSW